MKKLILTSPLPPSVNSYLNYKIATKGKRKFVQAYSAPQTVAYKEFFVDYVKDQIREQNWTRPEKGKLVYVRCTFFLDRKRKDPNNFLKVPFDALTEAGVYVDDDIALPLADGLYIDPKNPRIEIEIFESAAIGIFESQRELDIFMSRNCNLCKKNPTKCGIMKRLLDNRIIDEVENGQCLRKKEK